MQPQRDVADLADAGIGEQALEVVLEKRDQVGGEHGQQREAEHELRQRQLVEHQRLAEHGEPEADQHIDRDLGGGGGEEGGHRRGRVGVGVGQPLVQREQRQLERDTDGEEGQRGEHGTRAFDGAQALGHVGEVEHAGHQVEEADADDDEGRADRAHDQVAVGRGQRTAVAAQRDQHVSGQRGDFEEDEDVEGVAGDGDAEQAGQAEAEHRVVEVVQLARDLAFDAGAAVGQDHGRHAGHQHQHEAGQPVHAVLDAPGRRPAAELVGDDAQLAHLQPEADRGGEGGPGAGGDDAEGEAAVAQQHGQRRRQQRQHDLQGRQVRGEAHDCASSASCARLSSAVISSSSMVP